MENIPSFFKLAKNVSKQSRHKIKIGAVIVFNGTPVSVGYNQTKSNPNAPFTGLHAECYAIKYCGRKNLKGAKIFVFRENRKGKISCSRPCDDCLEELKKYGFKEMWYTTDEYPFFECEKI